MDSQKILFMFCDNFINLLQKLSHLQFLLPKCGESELKAMWRDLFVRAREATLARSGIIVPLCLCGRDMVCSCPSHSTLAETRAFLSRALLWLLPKISADLTGDSTVILCVHACIPRDAAWPMLFLQGAASQEVVTPSIWATVGTLSHPPPLDLLYQTTTLPKMNYSEGSKIFCKQLLRTLHQ